METSLLLLTTRTLSGRSNRYFGNVDKRFRLERKKNEQARLDYNLLFKPDRESEMHIEQLFSYSRRHSPPITISSKFKLQSPSLIPYQVKVHVA